MGDTPPQIVWQAHGSPVVDGCVEAGGRCYVCAGVVGRGMLVSAWLSSSFTDQTRVRVPTATYVCEACVYVQSRTSPVIGRPAKDGKKFGGNFRNYSHCWDGSYLNASKGQKDLLRDFLARDHSEPWFCAIADSGQKHVLPFAPMNGPGRSGQVRFEEANVLVPDDQSLIARITELLTDGVTKDEVGSGNYYVRTMRDHAPAARAFERDFAAQRGGNWFSLALWLSQRNEEEFRRRDAAKKEEQSARRQAAKAARDSRGGDGARAKKRVPARAKRAPAAQLLEPTPGQGPGGSETDDQCKRMGQPNAAKTADSKPRQGTLFDFD